MYGQEGELEFSGGDSYGAFLSLDGEAMDARYLFADEGPETDGIVSGLCPICNNSDREKYNAALASGEQMSLVARAVGCALADVERHVRLHLYPILAVIGEGVKEAMGVEVDPVDPPASLRKTKRHIDSMDRSYRRQGGSTVCRQVGAQTMVSYAELKDPEKQAVSREKVFSTLRHRVLENEGEYAIMDGQRVRSLSRWDDRRLADEGERSVKETINYFDGMLEVRTMALRVYNEIMDDDDDAERKSPKQYSERKNPKQYAAAIAAVREVRGVYENLARTSLIAASLGGAKKERVMSPELEDMIKQIGVAGAEKALSEAHEMKEAEKVNERS